MSLARPQWSLPPEPVRPLSVCMVAPPMVKHHEEAPPARAFEGVGAVEAVRNDAPWFGRVLGRCQGDGTSGHNDGCGCRPNVWWSVVAGQTGGGCSRSSARRFPRLRVRDAFFTSAAVQRVGARVNFAARASTLPHCFWRRKRRRKIHGRRDVGGPDPGGGKGPDVMHAHRWGHVVLGG